MEHQKTYDADELKRTLDEFLVHLHDDLPPGPRSELGGEVPSLRVTLSEHEFKARAALGRAAVEELVAARESEQRSTPSESSS